MKLVICFLLIFGAVLATESESSSTAAPKTALPHQVPGNAPPHNAPENVQPHKDPESTKPQMPEPSKEPPKSTEKVMMTTVPPPTTTLTPVNPPSNEKGHWNITEKNNTCILISGFISLPKITVQSSSHVASFNATVPPHAEAVGNCADGVIQFPLGRFNSSLQFKFELNKTHEPKEYFLSRVDGLLPLPNTTVNATVGFHGDNLHEFQTNVGQSFQCNSFLQFNFTDHKRKENVTVVIELKDFQLQAYKNTTKNDEFGKAIDGCPADHETPDIVPIIVGCALAILVVAVLVAYLISRQRSQARGYYSM